jgi:hypothetical protein
MERACELLVRGHYVIDFRYLLTTIVAIFLALGIGLLIGSGLLAEPLKSNLERDLQSEVDRNNELRDRINDQQGLIDALDTFSLDLEPQLIGEELTGDEIVLIRFEGTDGGLIDRLLDAVDIANGSLVTTITIRERMSMNDAGAVENLLEEFDASFVQDEEDPALLVGGEIGARLASDASGRTQEPSFGSIQDVLVEHGFLDVEAEGAVPIPSTSEFILAAGAEGDPPYDMQPFAEAMLNQMSDRTRVVVAENWASDWNFVTNLRGTDVRDDVATVDHADTVPGAASVVTELERLPAEEPGHFGFDSGADAVAPNLVTGG